MRKEYVITALLRLTACVFVGWGLYAWACVGIALGPSLSVPISITGLLSVALSCFEYDAKALESYPRKKSKTQLVKQGAKS